jgi:hypothetical protein
MKPLSELNRSLRAILGTCACVLFRLGGLGGLAGQLLCMGIDQNTPEMFGKINLQGRLEEAGFPHANPIIPQ